MNIKNNTPKTGISQDEKSFEGKSSPKGVNVVLPKGALLLPKNPFFISFSPATKSLIFC